MGNYVCGGGGGIQYGKKSKVISDFGWQVILF